MPLVLCRFILRRHGQFQHALARALTHVSSGVVQDVGFVGGGGGGIGIRLALGAVGAMGTGLYPACPFRYNDTLLDTSTVKETASECLSD